MLKQLFNALKSNILSAQMQSRSTTTRGSFWVSPILLVLVLQGQEEIVQFTKRNQPDESSKERLWSA